MMRSSSKIRTWEEAKKQVEDWQEGNEKIVFTNGCFDILHLGHIDYLEKARRLGDKMVVAINSDWSVRQLKGRLRPINQEYARLRMVAALACVDMVVLFTEPTPQAIIETIGPDILVKGKDYAPEEIVGADYVKKKGGRVETIALVAGFSTSGLIEKIKQG